MCIRDSRNSECPARRREGPWPPPRTPAGLVPAVPTFVTPQRCLARQSPRARAPLRKALRAARSSSAGDSPRPTVCPGPGQDWGSCALCWEGTSARGSNVCCEEEESDPGAGNRPGPPSLGARNPRGQRLRVAELVLALGRGLVPPWPDQAWGTGCIYIFVGYFALIKAVPALMLPADCRLNSQARKPDSETGVGACLVWLASQPHCTGVPWPLLTGISRAVQPALPRLAVPWGPGSTGQLLQQSQKYWQDLPARLTRAGTGTALPAEHTAPTWIVYRSEALCRVGHAGLGVPSPLSSRSRGQQRQEGHGCQTIQCQGYGHSSSGPDLWELGCGLGTRGSAGAIPSPGSPK